MNLSIHEVVRKTQKNKNENVLPVLFRLNQPKPKFKGIPKPKLNRTISVSDSINPRLTYLLINDAPEPWQIGFQDSASPTNQGIIELHDQVMFYLIIIAVGVAWALFRILYYFNRKRTRLIAKYQVHGTFIELIWTITPAFVLAAIAFPSFRLLYLQDEVIDPAMTLKAIGRQWYWTYEYSDYIDQNENCNSIPSQEKESNPGDTIEFDSYMVPTEELNLGQLRMLEVDNSVKLPEKTHVRVIVTGSDVIHSWGVPSLGVKIDAIPGRLNQTSVFLNRQGSFYGQCTELCGVHHSAMPICIDSLSIENFLAWIQGELLEG